jgi:dihydroflavonol-4-reductase
MRVFMTGATGFVGLNIVRALLGAGHDVTSFQRPGARRQYLDRLPVRVVTGQLSDHAALCAALDGAEAIIHTAGNTSCNWRDIEALEEANVGSTRAVLDAATACGVRRLVYTSSTATIGSYDPVPAPADESVELRGFRARSPYARTKQRAESILLGKHDGPECVVLNLAEVVGPYDHTLQWGRIVLAVAAGQLPFVPPGSGTFCPAADVAAAHVAALSCGRSDERYILGGHNVTFATFIEVVAEVVGRPPRPRRTWPYTLLRLQAQVQEGLQPWLARPPVVDAYRMRVFGGHHQFDDSKARRDLGYQPRSLRAAIEECLQWYREHGFLPASHSAEAGKAASETKWETA